MQPVAAPAVRVTHGSVPSQDPLEWLASHIYLLLNRFLASDTNQSTHKHTEGPASEPEAASDASATTQTPFRTVLRTHQDFSEEEGLKLVLAKPEEYLWSLLTLIGRSHHDAYLLYAFNFDNGDLLVLTRLCAKDC